MLELLTGAHPLPQSRHDHCFDPLPVWLCLCHLSLTVHSNSLALSDRFFDR
jgi:hypothetical protein